MNQASSPRTEAVSQELRRGLENLASHPEVLVCLDFDGCVAELVADPYLARPVPENLEAIQRLATLPGIRLAYVSGRPLTDLVELASPIDGMILIGSHGAEKYLGPDSPGLQLSAAQVEFRSHIIATLEKIAEQAVGTRVEHKPAGAALHVREVEDAELGDDLLQQAHQALDSTEGIHVKDGKRLFEAVVVKSTKGEAITELREQFAPGAVFFAGDDVTDEHGFAVLTGDDVGVKVGPEETAAQYRITEPVELSSVLQAFADLREQVA